MLLPPVLQNHRGGGEAARERVEPEAGGLRGEVIPATEETPAHGVVDHGSRQDGGQLAGVPRDLLSNFLTYMSFERTVIREETERDPYRATVLIARIVDLHTGSGSVCLPVLSASYYHT